MGDALKFYEEMQDGGAILTVPRKYLQPWKLSDTECYPMTVPVYSEELISKSGRRYDIWLEYSESSFSGERVFGFEMVRALNPTDVFMFYNDIGCRISHLRDADDRGACPRDIPIYFSGKVPRSSVGMEEAVNSYVLRFKDARSCIFLKASFYGEMAGMYPDSVRQMPLREVAQRFAQCEEQQLSCLNALKEGMNQKPVAEAPRQQAFHRLHRGR